ncbi:MAG: DUF4136 domain-containing protein [Acidiferrobacterales bacterium]
MSSARLLRISAIFLFATGLSTTVLASVTVDFDKNADFPNYKTFAWKKGTPAKGELMEKRIGDAVEQELQVKGLTQVESAPDLYVVTHASSKTERQVQVDNLGYAGYGWRGWHPRGPTSVNVYEIPIGTLMVDLVDGKTNELVWRGLAEKTLSDKPQKVAKLIYKVVKKMFKKFPPKK